MLVELRVRDLGVIVDLTLVLGDGMTALTGETGAGKTLVVEAIELLMGGRADPVLVRPGAEEAVVEGRFLADGEEVVLARSVPANGRSRAYVDGRMAPLSALAEAGGRLVDLHGQHAHQSLLSPAAQRHALDLFVGVDLAPLRAARAQVHTVHEQLGALGGDVRARAREIDLLRFQVAEIDGAGLADADEDGHLEQEETALADATASREAAGLAHQLLAGDGGAADALGSAIAAVANRPPLVEYAARLKSLVAELTDAAADLRDAEETLADDPARLEAIRLRRQLLHDLQRKYGDNLGQVMVYAGETRDRLAELESYEERSAQLERDLVAAEAAVAEAEAAVGAQRRKAAPALGAAVQLELRELALPRARFEVAVGDDPGEDVVFSFGANPGEAVLPLAKVASGGELARVMLALRLVLTGASGTAGSESDGPGTLIFDEVDAGVGGEAALAVGRALSALGAAHQVLVVTHLAQVAAFAEAQVGVRKEDQKGRTVATATLLDEQHRVIELSRMLSGQPDSATARSHAEELLSSVAGQRRRRSSPPTGSQKTGSQKTGAPAKAKRPAGTR